MTDRAIFLDRDGTLNEEVGYITDRAQFRLFDFAVEAVRMINAAGWRVIVITNQAGVARGLYDEAFLAGLHNAMIAELQAGGAQIDAVYHCPHLAPERLELDRHVAGGVAQFLIECDCRKPKAGMLIKAAKDFDLDLGRCWMIGDRYGDVAAAHSAGARGVLLLSGHGQAEYEVERDARRRPPEHIAVNLIEAVRWTLAQPA